MKKTKGKRHSLRAKMIGINVSIVFTAFILCGLLFVVSVGFLVGKYVNHDLDFFLTQMSDNLSTKLSYMEDVVYSVRDSEELMQYLKTAGGSEPASIENTQKLWEKEANISSDKNQGEKSAPIVDKCYLFDQAGNGYAAFYYALVESQIKENDLLFEKLYREKQSRYECRRVDGRTFIIYPLLDDNMDSIGSIIYELNTKALESVMASVNDYEGAFWLLYDSEQTIDGVNYEASQEQYKTLIQENKYDPYTQTVGKESFRMYHSKMCLGLNAALGIPENQAITILYRTVKIYVIGIIVILLSGLIGFIIFTYKMTKPIKEVTMKMQKVQEGEFDTKLPDYDNQEFHEISMVFNEMTEYINHLIKEVYEKQISIKEMELKFLQTQMNPHFMFNVLNAIALQAKMDGNEKLFKMISSFTQLIQAKIYRSKEEKVQICQELEYVEYYLYLQNFRYGNRLQYEIKVQDKFILDMYIPKLCLQLIVENAVVHGIEPQVDEGKVSLQIYEKEGSVYIEIEDNGVGFPSSGEIALPIQMEESAKDHNHVGLNNAHHIIRLMYGEDYGIRIFSKSGEGTIVKIHIPFDKGDKEEKDALQGNGSRR